MLQKIPTAVAQKLKDVDALMQAQPNTADGGQPNIVEPVQSVPAEPGQPNTVEQVVPVDQVQPVEQGQQGGQSDVETAALPDDWQRQLDAAENRYRTLAGMIKVKDEEIRRLQELLTQLSENIPSRPEERPEASSDEQKDIDEYGADMVEMVKRTVTRIVSPLEKRLATLESSATQTSAAVTDTLKDRFERQLTELVPNWREIDADPEFGVWLRSNQARLELTQRYMATYNTEGIAELFRLYEAQHSKQTSDKPQKRLEQKVAPAKSVASGQPSEQKKLWTRTEIAQVYKNRRAYDEKTFAELEREIASAQREGRVDFSK